MPHYTTELEEPIVGALQERDLDGEPPVASAVEDRGQRWPRFSLRVMRPTVSFLTSLIVHLVVLLALALVVMQPKLPRVVNISGNWSVEPEPLQVFEMNAQLPATDSGTHAAELDPELAVTAGLPSLEALSPGARQAVEPGPKQSVTRNMNVLLEETHLPLGGGLGGRSPELRAQLAAAMGGTAASEEAVERGLRWLAAHQRQDGSWHFNYHENTTCLICRNPGTASTSTGATGLVLLAFLGAGYTHQQGPYKEVVDKGLYYLTSRMLLTPQGGDLQEGSMYGHGIATLALCEAYALTQDANLRAPAQHAINFICNAQHSEGGWRYFPGQPGDTTVFSWQIMALKSARLSNLEVPSPVIMNAMHYLDTVQDMNGSTYRYQKHEEKSPSSTAIGLLSRMYFGWRRDDPRIAKGILYLDAIGPSKNDIYFNYYATQVLHHYQGTYWTSWNERLREYLIATQANEGHENGSWFFPDRHGSIGGRLYTTAMCVMTLEVYYRYMPLYDDPAILTGF